MDWVEERAEAILSAIPSYVWDGETLPVPVEDIVDTHFGLHVLDVEDMTAAPGCPPLEPPQTLSGLLLADKKQIWCNAEEGRQWPPRRRFTIAHELGHWVLHRPGQLSLFCRTGTVLPEDEVARRQPRAEPMVQPELPERPPLPETEEEANAFAAAMLMPARLLEHHYRKTTRDFESLCEIFGSSQAAMGRRLHAVI